MTKRKDSADLKVMTIPSGIVNMIVTLNQQEHTDRQIASALGIHHATVAKYRRLQGLTPNGVARRNLRLVGTKHAKCSRCAEVKSLADWPIAREGKKSPYRLSYCRDCRRKQLTLAQNKTELRNVRIRWNRLRARCKRFDLICVVTLEHLWQQWLSQAGCCFYTDVQIAIDFGKGSQANSFSIDKIEPCLGYIDGNIVIATRRANTIKHDVTVEEMKHWMPDWYRRVIEKRARDEGKDRQWTS